MKKSIVFAIVLALVATMAFAQASQEAAATKQRVVTTTCRASYTQETWYTEMNAAFEAETGIHVDVQPTPGNDDDHDKKVNLDLLAGGTIDVIPSNGFTYLSDRIDAGYLLPLNEAIPTAEANHGNFLEKDAEGNFYALPVKQELWCVFYNKTMFDKAGVAYPTSPWTWDEFAATAQKFASKDGSTYGAWMERINVPWLYIEAIQQGVPFYKEDGTCNFDDPRFAAAIAKVKASCDTGAYMPYSAVKADNLSWDAYAIVGDHVAMFPQGNWYTRLLIVQQEKYPRDWELGVVAMPAPADGQNNLVSKGYVSINKNAAHMEEAKIYCEWLGKNQWKYEKGIPALASLSAEDQQLAFGSFSEQSKGQVTIDELYTAWVANGMGTVNSDIIGTAANQYKDIVVEEVRAYHLDMQSLDTTIANVVKRVNEAIANVQ